MKSRDFSGLLAFAQYCVQVTDEDHENAFKNSFTENIAAIAADTHNTLVVRELVAFDSVAHTWQLTHSGVAYFASAGPHDELPLLIYGFLFGSYHANDPSLPVTIKPWTDGDAYHSYYLQLADHYHKLDTEVNTGQTTAYGQDHRHLITEIFSYDLYANQYRLGHTALLLQSFIATPNAKFLFETDLLYVVLGILISAAL